MNHALSIIAGAVIAPEERFGASLQLSVVGMLVVFSALALIQIMLVLLERATRQAPAPEPVVASVVASPAPPPAAPITDGIAPEIIAVISAAVVAAVGTGARITRIRLAGKEAESMWSDLGRRDQHTSHRLRKKSQ
ncbi:hypothetical protein GC173_16405 [bacterium]|nr:hypothetical protein [bacterium]